MKPEQGEYAIITPQGVFDLVEIAKDKKEMAVLSELKEELLRHGKFREYGKSKICLASIAAFIMYMSSICEILENDNESGVTH